MNKIQAMELAAGISGLITGMETDLLKNIAAYLLSGKLETDTARWKIRKLAELGKLNQKNIETISSYVSEEKSLAELTVKRATVSALKDAETGFRRLTIAGIVKDAPAGSMEKTMSGIIELLGKQAKNDLNIINTTMLYKAKGITGKAIRQAAELSNKQEFIDIISKAAGKDITEVETRTAAVSQCLKEIAEKGIPAFVDKGGREWTPEAYVNMCVRATAKNTESKALFERMKDYDTSLIEVTSHLGARPKCSKDQGKIFDLNNGSGFVEDLDGKKVQYFPWSSSSYGAPDGILGINCQHHAYPFFPGYSLQSYFPYDQAENDEEYRKLQKQRELERRVRASKRECAMLKNGDPEMFKKASVRLKERTKCLEDYCEANGFTNQKERTSVLGFGRSESGKVTAAYKKALKEEEAELMQKELDNLTNRAILEEKIASGELTLKLGGKQKNHIIGTLDKDTNSYFIISDDEIQKIIDSKHGTGTVIINKQGQIKEIIDIDEGIAFDVDLNTKLPNPTNRATIHFSKKGTHLVPTKRKD